MENHKLSIKVAVKQIQTLLAIRKMKIRTKRLLVFYVFCALHRQKFNEDNIHGR